MASRVWTASGRRRRACLSESIPQRHDDIGPDGYRLCDPWPHTDRFWNKHPTTRRLVLVPDLGVHCVTRRRIAHDESALRPTFQAGFGWRRVAVVCWLGIFESRAGVTCLMG